MIEITQDEWRKEAIARYGKNLMDWKFICPSCGYIYSIQEFKDAGAPRGAAAFSCIGRWTGSKKEMFDKTGGPCNYAGGGLIGINPIRVLEADGKHSDIFDFADNPLKNKET